MKAIHIQSKVAFQKGRSLDLVMKQLEHGKEDMGNSFTDDDLIYLTHVYNFLHYLLSKFEVYLNSHQVYNYGTQGHEAFILKSQQEILKLFWLVRAMNWKKSHAVMKRGRL